MFSTLLACIIFLITLVLVIWQPKNLSIGWSACGGAILALLVGVVNLQDVLHLGGCRRTRTWSHFRLDKYLSVLLKGKGTSAYMWNKPGKFQINFAIEVNIEDQKALIARRTNSREHEASCLIDCKFH